LPHDYKDFLKLNMPPAARGAFLKNRPPGPPAKLLFNKKFLEVSEPFYKKVLTRRRQHAAAPYCTAREFSYVTDIISKP
jgi:hypothetical protein